MRTVARADDVFLPIAGPKASAEVVDQITFAITSGRFLPGSRLPNIDELARQMSVSRPTVVDALRILARAGVVETRRGNTGGVLVSSSIVPPRLLRLSRRRAAHGLSALVEARRPVEMELALLACQRADEQDFADLGRAVEMLKSSISDPRGWVQANNLFHYTVGRAARSPVLSQFQHDVIEEMTVVLSGWSTEYYSGADRVIDMHERTLKALMFRDARRVREAMDDHLHDAELIDAASHQPKVRGHRPPARAQRSKPPTATQRRRSRIPS